MYERYSPVGENLNDPLFGFEAKIRAQYHGGVSLLPLDRFPDPGTYLVFTGTLYDVGVVEQTEAVAELVAEIEGVLRLESNVGCGVVPDEPLEVVVHLSPFEVLVHVEGFVELASLDALSEC